MQSNAEQHIFVTGACGAGKSTLAKALSHQLQLPLHRLDDDPDFRQMLQYEPDLNQQDTLMPAHMSSARDRVNRLQAIGAFLLRYGLVLVIGWIGAMKFTAYEAAGIQPLVASSPLLRWLYQYLSVQAVSTLFGIVEITIAVMIAMRPVAAKMSALGSAMAVLMFLTALSFLCSLPGWEPTLGGFPALSGSGLLQQVACTLTPMRPLSLESPRCWYVIAIASRGVLPSTGDIARVAALVVTALYDLVEKGITKLWHRPGFDIDEDVLPVGVEILALAALDLLQ